MIDKPAARAKEIRLNLYTLAGDEGNGVRIEHTAGVNMVNDICSVSKLCGDRRADGKEEMV